MKILIIGGTGNISTAITKQLQGKHHDLTLFNNDKERPAWLDDSIRVITGNRRDIGSFVEQLFASGKYDCIMDMICFEPSDAAMDIEVFRGKTDQFIFCSTVDVYSKTPSRYPVDESFELSSKPSFTYAYKKMECERLLWEAHRRQFFKLTVLRPSFTYNESWSPGIHSFGGQTYHLDRLRKGEPFIMHGDGTSVWMASHRNDTATAFTGAAGNPKAYGEAYNVTGDEMMTHNQIWITIAEILEAPYPDFLYIPSQILSKLAPAESEWCVENFMHNAIYSNAKAKSDLGFRYSVSFREGASACLDYLITNNLIESSDKYPFYDQVVDKWNNLKKTLAS